MQKNRPLMKLDAYRAGRISIIVGILLILAVWAVGQPASDIHATGQYTQSVLVPAQGAPAFVDVRRSSTVGGSSVYVRKSHGDIAVSLILPGGAEVNSANAAQSGYEFLESGPGEQATTLTLLDSVMVPNVSIIRLPADAQPGFYRVKAVGVNLAEDGAITVQYTAETGVK